LQSLPEARQATLPKHGLNNIRAAGEATAAQKVQRCRRETGLGHKVNARPPATLLALGPGANRSAAAPVAAGM